MKTEEVGGGMQRKKLVEESDIYFRFTERGYNECNECFETRN
jgi:hypothetical protein